MYYFFFCSWFCRSFCCILWDQKHQHWVSNDVASWSLQLRSMVWALYTVIFFVHCDEDERNKMDVRCGWKFGSLRRAIYLPACGGRHHIGKKGKLGDLEKLQGISGPLHREENGTWFLVGSMVYKAWVFSWISQADQIVYTTMLFWLSFHWLP